MAQTSEMRFCGTCEKKTLHIEDSTNHLLHWILVFITAGLWLLPYLLIILFAAKESQCTVCGKSGIALGTGTIIVLVIVGIYVAPDIIREVKALISYLQSLIAVGWEYFWTKTIPWIRLGLSSMAVFLLITSFAAGLYVRPINNMLRKKRVKHPLTPFYWFGFIGGVWLTVLIMLASFISKVTG